MQQFQRLNNIIGILVGVFATIVYALTMESSASLWDCGEFIASAQKQFVVHPPGAPLFLMIARVFTLFAPSPETVSVTMNFMSALCSGLAMTFLFWVTTYMARRIVLSEDRQWNKEKIWTVLGAGLIAALSGTFVDSIWFSAVEAEVYSMSLLVTSVVFWLICKWDAHSGEPDADRYLILIAFLMGCSIFIHWLNLLCIPALAFVYYFKRYQPSLKGIVLTLLISGSVLLFFLNGVITGIVDMMANIELLFVNSFGLPFSSGVIFTSMFGVLALVSALFYTTASKPSWAKLLGIISAGLLALVWLMAPPGGGTIAVRLLLIGLVSAAFYFWKSEESPLLNTILWAVTFVLIGFSTIAAIVIRSKAGTNINMNSPKDIVALSSYLHREQYGSRPFLTGYYYDTEPVDMKVLGDKYAKGKDKYDKVGTRADYDYGNAPVKIFPRIYDSKFTEDYERWLDLRKGEKPGFIDNIKFFFKYQIGHMYIRYLFWNFVGRQNDEQGYGKGDYENGNWISGINFIDSIHLINQEKLPDFLKNNPTRNTFYFIPFIVGMFGFIFQFLRDNRRWIVVLLLFFLTGLAIIIYGNSPPIEPRERDYIFAASFWAFCIWLGLGVVAIIDFIRKYVKGMAGVGLGILLAAIAPLLMGMKGWDDHDRSGRPAARDFAANYLNSCAPNAILFTQGDNDTYPLWYAQEVEGIRKDVRVVNLSLLGVDWYIDQLRYKQNDAAPVPINYTPDKYRGTLRDQVIHRENNAIAPADRYIDLKQILGFIGEEKNGFASPDGEKYFYYPTKKFSIDVDVPKVLANGTVEPEDSTLVVPIMEWTMPRGSLLKNDLMVLDIIAANNWQRPIYFAISVERNAYLGLQKFFQLEGLAYRLVPIPIEKQASALMGRAQTKILKDHLSKFKYGNATNPKVFLSSDIKRMLYNFRNVYVEQADQLIRENKKEEAAATLDICQKELFYPGMEYDYYVYTLISGYYDAGAFDKGNALIEKVIDDSCKRLDLIKSQSLSYQKAAKGDVERTMQFFGQFAKMAKAEKQDALADKVTKAMMAYK